LGRGCISPQKGWKDNHKTRRDVVKGRLRITDFQDNKRRPTKGGKKKQKKRGKKEEEKPNGETEGLGRTSLLLENGREGAMVAESIEENFDRRQIRRRGNGGKTQRSEIRLGAFDASFGVNINTPEGGNNAPRGKRKLEFEGKLGGNRVNGGV